VVHELIDSEVTLTHWTGPDGTRLEETALHRPYTLVLTKTDALFAQEHEARARDESDLKGLEAKWAPSTETTANSPM
jgi:hypothetical protein